jgi:hypothetical protein
MSSTDTVIVGFFIFIAELTVVIIVFIIIVFSLDFLFQESYDDFVRTLALWDFDTVVVITDAG